MELAVRRAAARQGAAAEQDGGGPVLGQELRRLLDPRGGDRLPGPQLEGGAPRRGLLPGEVGRHHEGCHLPRGTVGGGDGVHHVVGQVLGRGGRPVPAGDGAGERGDVRLERRVVAVVVGGMVADHVDDGAPGPAGVVQVGDAVGEARAEVQQRRRRPSGHSRVTVCGPGGDPLEQREHGPHLGHLVEGGHRVHLRGAGIGEAGDDPELAQGAEEGPAPVHDGSSTAASSTCPGARIPRGSNPALMRLMSASLTGSSSSRK